MKTLVAAKIVLSLHIRKLGDTLKHCHVAASRDRDPIESTVFHSHHSDDVFQTLAGAESQREKDKLRLLLNLTNRLVSTLDLKDLLRSICSSVRPIMDCDSVTVMLPDATNRLRVMIHDFPDDRGIIREGVLVRGILPRRVFRTGKLWTGY